MTTKRATRRAKPATTKRASAKRATTKRTAKVPVARMIASDKFRPGTRDDVSDLALLPRRFDRFVIEIRTSFEVLTDKILPTIQKLNQTQADIVARLTSMNQDLTRLSIRVAHLERLVLDELKARHPEEETT